MTQRISVRKLNLYSISSLSETDAQALPLLPSSSPSQHSSLFTIVPSFIVSCLSRLGLVRAAPPAHY